MYVLFIRIYYGLSICHALNRWCFYLYIGITLSDYKLSQKDEEINMENYIKQPSFFGAKYRSLQHADKKD